MTTQTNDEFMGAVSPHCIIHDPVRRDAVRHVVTDYAHAKGLPESIEWATLRASNALDAGESAHRAIEAGQTAVDEWPRFFGTQWMENTGAQPIDGNAMVDVEFNNGRRIESRPAKQWSWTKGYAEYHIARWRPTDKHAPITTAWKAAKSMGLAGIHCTASGVAGYYGRMYVRVESS